LAAKRRTGLEHAALESRIEAEGGSCYARCLRIGSICVPSASSVRSGWQTSGNVQRRSVESGHQRPLHSVFGEVSVKRLAYRQRGEANLYPADGVLNLARRVGVTRGQAPRGGRVIAGVV